MLNGDLVARAEASSWLMGLGGVPRDFPLAVVPEAAVPAGALQPDTARVSKSATQQLAPNRFDPVTGPLVKDFYLPQLSARMEGR